MHPITALMRHCDPSPGHAPALPTSINLRSVHRLQPSRVAYSHRQSFTVGHTVFVSPNDSGATVLRQSEYSVVYSVPTVTAQSFSAIRGQCAVVQPCGAIAGLGAPGCRPASLSVQDRTLPAQ